jgi:hypothetical protein
MARDTLGIAAAQQIYEITALRTAVHRLRLRYAELLREEIAAPSRVRTKWKARFDFYSQHWKGHRE